jgi:hypothetical protein
MHVHVRNMTRGLTLNLGDRHIAPGQCVEIPASAVSRFTTWHPTLSQRIPFTVTHTGGNCRWRCENQALALHRLQSGSDPQSLDVTILVMDSVRLPTRATI